MDRGRPGSKHHLIIDTGGIPVAVRLTGGNRNDVTQWPPLITRFHRFAASPADPGPGNLLADRGYEHDKYRVKVCDLPLLTCLARHSGPPDPTTSALAAS